MIAHVTPGWGRQHKPGVRVGTVSIWAPHDCNDLVTVSCRRTVLGPVGSCQQASLLCLKLIGCDGPRAAKLGELG